LRNNSNRDCVFAAYALGMAMPWRTLTTIGEACHAVKAETLEHMIDWVADKLTREHWSIVDIKAVLAYS